MHNKNTENCANGIGQGLLGFDMAVAVSQMTLNFQLSRLWKTRVIRRELNIKQGTIKLTSEIGAPRVVLGIDGKPGQLLFVLHLTRGELAYWDLSGEEPVKRELEFTDWTYAFRVDMNFLQISQAAALHHTAIPAEVKQVLSEFNDDMFTIRHLVMDFQSADLAAYDPAHSSMKIDGDPADFAIVEQFRKSLETYFAGLAGTEHPYILGYSVEHRPATSRGPAMFEPTGATFSTFSHPDDAGLNTLNFMLMTGHQALPAIAGPLPRPLVTAFEHDGRMAIDTGLFRERYVEGVLFAAVARALGLPGQKWVPLADRDAVRRSFDLDDGRAGRSFPDLHPGTFGVFRHTDNLGEDDGQGNVGYGKLVGRDSDILNIYHEERTDIACALWPEDGSKLAFRGRAVFWSERVYTEYPFNARTAMAWADATQELAFRLELRAGADGKVNVVMRFEEPIGRSGWDRNIIAKFTDEFARGLGLPTAAALATTTLSWIEQRLGYYRNSLQNDLQALLGELQTRVILPAGDVLFFSNIAHDDEGNVLLDIDYKTETANERQPAQLLGPDNALPQLEASSELMRDYIAGSAVTPDRRIRALQDADGEPLVLSVGNDGRLFLIRRSGVGTGWRVDDLSSGLGEGLVVSAFEASQAESGAIYLAVAVHPDGRPEQTRLFFTRRLSNSAAVTDWSAFTGRWSERSYGRTQSRVTRILMGTADDGQGAPLTIVVLAGGDEQTHVCVNSEVGDTSWSWQPYALPENADELLDLAIGTVAGDRGVFALYRIGPDQTLEFSSLPDPEFAGKMIRYAFPLPTRAHAIAVLPGDGDTSDLFVAGAGVHVFRPGEPARLLADACDVGQVRALHARRDHGGEAVWTVSEDDMLRMLEGVDGQWSTTLIAGDVTQVAPLRNNSRAANQLLSTGPDGVLRHRWQDPGTRLWAAAELPLPSTGVALEVLQYSTRLRLLADGQPVAGGLLQVSSSEWTHAALNGAAAVLSPGRSLSVRTDALGSLTINIPVSSLAVPTLRVTVDGLPVAVTIDPAKPVIDRLREIRSGEDLVRAQTRSGRPLMAANPAPATLEAAAQAIRMLVEVRDDLATPVAQRVAHNGPPRRWALVFGDTGAEWMDLAQGGLEAVLGRPLADAVARFFGDLVEPVLDGLQRFGAMVVEAMEGAYRVLVRIGEAVWTCVVDTAAAVYKTLQLVLKEVLGVDLDALVDWLGFVFDWNDIKHTHRVMCNIARQSVAHVRANLDGLAAPIDRFFDTVEDQLRAWQVLPPAQRGVTLQDRLHGAPAPSAAVQSLLAGPVMAWSSHKLAHGGALPTDPLAIVLDNPVVAACLAYFRDVVLPLVDSVVATIIDLAHELQDAVTRGTLTVELAVVKICQAALGGLLDVGRKLSIGALHLLSDFLQIIVDIVDSPVEIPLITGLYKQFVGSDRMSLLDGLMLLFTAPATMLFKVTTGKAPFAGPLAAMATMEHEELFALLRGPAVRTNGCLLATNDEPEEMSADQVYSYVCGFVYPTLNLVSGALNIRSALASNTSPPSTEALNFRQSKFWLREEALQVVLGALKFASSYPTGTSSHSITIQRVLWGTSIFLVAKDFVALFVPEKATLAKIIGSLEIVEASVEAKLFVAVLILDLVDKESEEYDPGMSAWMFIENFVQSLAGMFAGATRLDVEPDTKAALGLFSGLYTAAASGSGIIRTIVELKAGLTHYAY